MISGVLAEYALPNPAERPSREEVIDHLAEIVMALRVAFFGVT